MNPKLDRLVATRVTKWTPKHDPKYCNGTKAIRCGACGGSGHGNCYGRGDGPIQIPCGPDWYCCESARMPPYSSDIAAAWELIEAWEPQYWALDNGWREVNGERVGGVTCTLAGNGMNVTATEATVELAICVAMLRALRVPESEIQEAMK